MKKIVLTQGLAVKLPQQQREQIGQACRMLGSLSGQGSKEYRSDGIAHKTFFKNYLYSLLNK